MPFVDAQVQTPIPWLGAGIECDNRTGAFQNIGVGRHSCDCKLTLSHIPFHTGFIEEGEEEPTTSLVLKSVP